MNPYHALTERLATETEIRDDQNNLLGVEKRWTNDTNQAVEFNPPGIVCQPAEGLFINIHGDVALVHAPEVDEHPPPNGIHVPPAVRVSGAKAPVRAVMTVKKKLKKIHVVPHAHARSKSDDASFKPKRKK